jgi:hypothetical protein
MLSINSIDKRFLLGDLKNSSLNNIITMHQEKYKNKFWNNPITECTRCNVFKETYRTYYI